MSKEGSHEAAVPSGGPSARPSLRESFAVGTVVAGFDRRWTFRGLDDDDRWRLLCGRDRLKLPDTRTGIPVHPDEAAMITALRDHTLSIVKIELPIRARAICRGLERTMAEVLADDPEAEYRMAVCRRWDASRRRGDRNATKDSASIEAWFEREFGSGELVARFGRKSASTLRTWIRERGWPGDRRWCDMEAVPGQGRRRGRVLGISYELAVWHASRAAVNPNRTCVAGWRALRRDVRRARAGLPLKMDRYRSVERDYSSLKEMDRTTFRKLFDSLSTNANARAKTSYDAVRSRRGGGGRSLEASRCWEIVEMDEKEVSTHLFVDERRRIPLGSGSTTIAVERRSTAIVGRDVSWEAPSTSSALRTLIHATSLKDVPPEFAKDFPELALVGAKIGALIVDNAAQYVGETFEDAGGDVVMDIVLAGTRKGTDKALVESRHAILRTWVDDLMPSRKLPIAILREFNIVPAGRTAIDLATYTRYFDNGIALYNTTRRKDLGNRSPLEILMEDRRLHGAPLPADVEQFKRAVSAVVVSRVVGGDGVVVNGLRYVRPHNHPGLLEDFVLASGDRRQTKRLRFDAKVKIDYSDLSKVWIFNPRLVAYEELRCTKERYSHGLSLPLHNIVLLGLPDRDADDVVEDRLLEIRGRIEDAIERDHPADLAATDTAHERALSDPRLLAALADRASVKFRPASPTGLDAVPQALNLERGDASGGGVRLRRGDSRNDLDAGGDDGVLRSPGRVASPIRDKAGTPADVPSDRAGERDDRGDPDASPSDGTGLNADRQAGDASPSGGAVGAYDRTDDAGSISDVPGHDDDRRGSSFDIY